MYIKMGDSSNPSKKPRLDKIKEDHDSDPENGDVWGNMNFTAEELDLLEERATQEVAQQAVQVTIQDVVQNNLGQPSCFNVATNREHKNTVLDTLKLLQYELEGKNKQLSQLLTKTLKELNEERLNREQIIDMKTAKFKQTELDLQREIDKLNTRLMYKGLEVRKEKDKIHYLEDKLKQKADEIQLHVNSNSQAKSPVKQPSLRKSPSKLPKWCSFDYRNRADTAEAEIQTEITGQRRFPLHLQAPRGEPREIDTVCKLLSCRIVDSCCERTERSPVHDCEGNINPMEEFFKQARDHSSMSVTALRCNGESDNVWGPYELVLQEYVSHLKTERSSLKLAAEKVFIFSEGRSHSNLDQENGVLSCLRSLTKLLFHQCPKGSLNYSREPNNNRFEKKGNLEVYSLSSMPLFNGDEDKMEVTFQNRSYTLLELLIMLANPTTYPDGYKKSSVIEWALSALVAWSSHSKESLESCTQDLPFHSLVSGGQGMECAYLTLKLMSSLIGLTSFKGALVHHSDSWCILCSIGNLCGCISDQNSNTPGIFMNMIGNFLFGVLNCYGSSIIRKESHPCSAKLLQGIVTMMSRQLESSQDCNYPNYASFMGKGIMLLCFMAAHLPNFQARRFLIEEKYMLLICQLSRLCKTNSEFRRFRDKVKELWDFKGEIAELDNEETHNAQVPHPDMSEMF